MTLTLTLHKYLANTASLALYQVIKKRLVIFKTCILCLYAFILENDQTSLADPSYFVLNSNFMQR